MRAALCRCGPRRAARDRSGDLFQDADGGLLWDLPSQRAIAARCDDSRALREFLGYDLTEATPEQSSFTVIRQRLPLETIKAVHAVVLRALREHGLLRLAHPPASLFPSAASADGVWGSIAA